MHGPVISVNLAPAVLSLRLLKFDIIETLSANLPLIKSTLNRASMKKLRSQEWFGRKDKMGFLYRSWIKNQGWPHDLFEGRPVIGSCNAWSELTPCNAHFRELAEYVKRGVWEAGGFPLEFPVLSLGETLLRPTAMLFRNLASMAVEESIRGNPVDGVVLLMGCDKTTPHSLWGRPRAISRRLDSQAARCYPASFTAMTSVRARESGRCTSKCAPARCRSRSSSKRKAVCTAPRGTA